MINYKFKGTDIIALFIILLFLVMNLLTLMAFPTVHSDEIWLKEIAEEMIDSKSFSITEPFYDLYPRVVHPFRWLYNSALILFLNVFGNSVYAVRLLSLTFGTLSLLVFYQILKNTFENRHFAWVGLLLLSLDIQFIYSTHMGRQETIILFLLLFGYLQFLKKTGLTSVLWLTAIILVGMGVHPNSFILGVSFAALFFISFLMHNRPIWHLILLIGLTSIGVAIYGIIGYQMNPYFMSEYLGYGASVGVELPVSNRLEGFYWYWYKLYKQIGGTYDLFNIKWQLMVFGTLIAIWTPVAAIRIFKAQFKKESASKSSNGLTAYSVLMATSLAILIIGRYNQTAVVFIIPFVILLLLDSSVRLFETPLLKHKKSPFTSFVFLILLTSLWAFGLFSNLKDYDAQRFYTLSYENMLVRIESVVPKSSVVLGNLNIIEAFDPHRFYDVRNLGYLKSNQLSIEKYILDRKIEYIVLHEEMDYIARNSPKWDFLYISTGFNLTLRQYLDSHAIEIARFENPLYAMRISKFSGTYPWVTTIYKVNY